jgi:hypothetical protein
MLFVLTACSNTSVWKNDSFDTKASTDKLKNGAVVAENDLYQLVWVSTSCSVSLIEKETGLTWGTVPVSDDEPQFDSLGMPIKKHALVESAIAIEYMNPDTNIEEQSLSYTSAVSNGRVIAEKIKDGVCVKYYFDDVEIMVPVNYKLREDSVSVNINTKEIQENTRRLTAISVSPFWCSAKNDALDSYLFFPSGTGAIIEPNTISQTGVTYSAQVYGDDPVMTMKDDVTNEKSVRLPVFGAKSGLTASLGIVESSAESAIIETKVGSSAIKYSGVYTKFLVRGYSPNLAVFMNGVEKELNIYSLSMIDSQLAIGFYPLSNDNANYSGMANLYKEYLTEKEKLKKTTNDSSINISVVGGMLIDKSFLGVPYKELLPSATISETQDIITEISKKTNAKISARMLGFGKSGIDNTSYAGGYGIDKKLGTKKQLSQLSEFCNKNGIDLYFDFDLISLKSSSGGYNKIFDSAYSSLNKIANIYEFNVASRSRIDSSKYNLLSRELLIDGAKKVAKNINKWNISGFSLSALSNTAYSDYSIKDSVKYYSKLNMQSDVGEIYGVVFKDYKIAADDANLYAALKANVIFNSPTVSSNQLIFTEDVPFYQMVFKGYVPIAGQQINTAANWKSEFLRTVESGCGLNYLLTYNYSNNYINHNGYEFVSSKYDDIKNKIYDDYDLVKEYYNQINGAEISQHAIMDSGLHHTTYSNGVQGFVNYSKGAIKSPIGKVEPESFKWGR